jgi:hypothetical protein
MTIDSWMHHACCVFKSVTLSSPTPHPVICCPCSDNVDLWPWRTCGPGQYWGLWHSVDIIDIECGISGSWSQWLRMVPRCLIQDTTWKLTHYLICLSLMCGDTGEHQKMVRMSERETKSLKGSQRQPTKTNQHPKERNCDDQRRM